LELWFHKDFADLFSKAWVEKRVVAVLLEPVDEETPIGGKKNTISLSARIAFTELNLEGFYMGIKPSYIKNLGNELVTKQRTNFSNNFEENKLQLEKSAVIGSKRVRNRVAGYITRKMNSKKHT
jgi:small subunit ribosomal protein S17e